jgi:hypothetical protein
MIVTLNPFTLPGNHCPCLYVYHKDSKLKLGLSNNLRNRNLEYKGRKFSCVGYITPVPNLREAEKSLSQLFKTRFKQTHQNGEWFEGSKEDAEAALVEWTISQVKE